MNLLIIAEKDNDRAEEGEAIPAAGLTVEDDHYPLVHDRRGLLQLRYYEEVDIIDGKRKTRLSKMCQSQTHKIAST